MWEESKNWQRPTDTEKLISAFDELCKNNIIALHFAGYTTRDGEYEVVEVERALRSRGKKSDGYCFYHEQDLGSAVFPEQPSLMLAFQKINNSDDETTVKVGKKVIEVLEKHGFKIKWDETPTRKIEILDFAWQKIYDSAENDLQNYDAVLAKLLG